MVIADPAHPMAAGLTGTISFLQSSKGISYITSNELGTAAPALVVETTTAGQYTLIGYTPGQTMADNTAAPEARVGLSGLHNQNANPTTDGWAILDATITWATAGSNGGGGSGNSTNGGGGGVTIVETITVTHAYAGQNIGVSVDGLFEASLADHLGSATVSRQSDGATVTQRYTPFGAIRGGGGNQMPADLTFTGQTDDPETGLIDYNARAYDPQLGRFIMADPVLDGLNRYTYVRNNPVRYTDPTGYCVDADPQYGSVTVGCNVAGNGGCTRNTICEALRRSNELYGPGGSIDFAGTSAGPIWYPIEQEIETLTATDIVVGAGRTVVLDERECLGPDAGVGGCGLEVAGIVPWGRVFKIPGAAARAAGRAPTSALDDFTNYGGEFVDDALRSPVVRPDLGNLSAKIERQMGTRGWTSDLIEEAVQNGNAFPAVNKLGGIDTPATRYVNPTTGQSVVIDNATGEVIQVGGPGFLFD